MSWSFFRLAFGRGLINGLPFRLALGLPVSLRASGAKGASVGVAAVVAFVTFETVDAVVVDVVVVVAFLLSSSLCGNARVNVDSVATTKSRGVCRAKRRKSTPSTSEPLRFPGIDDRRRRRRSKSERGKKRKLCISIPLRLIFVSV